MERILVAGLGNPGSEYENTRHNAGFMALDAIQKEHHFSEFHLDKKMNVLIAEGSIDNVNLLLAKPQTFMNNSGEAVKKLAQFYKVGPANIIVIYDDIDIPLGEIKFVMAEKGSGSAGHKGIESVMQELDTPHFQRLRIGILPAQGKPENVETFVLKKFLVKEQEAITRAIQKTTEILPSLFQ